eukprot:CAMPEP_0183710540 /NCGR_PEP_ID=MMETSP0737-20130205/6250_1 /TAXON_ID=385413 /ORGANISM="Thalassiosira miniscula, Strain CCMP1093" /LENGTH=220 /DNA_ID=CAMNT_0025938833 /DNA_START=47 /DNA_END=709 /DNA_ORIENTATION=+
MGNTLPITSPPKPSSSRAVIFMVPRGIRSYLKEPWRRPVGLLRIIGSTDEIPPALDGVVPIEEYKEKINAVADRASNYKGGTIHIGVAMFQACLFAVILLGFFLTRYMRNGKPFFNPITLGVLGTLEFGVLSQSGRILQREEIALTKELLELFRPWREQYGIMAKMRKTRGHNIEVENKEDQKSTCYCLVLEKMGPDDDLDTVSLSSSFTDIESEFDSEV